VLEAKQLSPGLVLARCVLPARETHAAVCLLNLEDKPQRVPADCCLGTLVRAEVLSLPNHQPLGYDAVGGATSPNGVTCQHALFSTQPPRPATSDQPPRPATLDQPPRPVTSTSHHDQPTRPATVGSAVRPISVTRQHTPSLDTYPGMDLQRGGGEWACLELVIESMKSSLNAADLEVATNFVHDYADIFSKSEFDLGRCDMLPHRIETG